MENGKNVSMQLSIEKAGSLAGFITETIIKGSSPEQIDYWLGNKKELKKNVNQVFSLHADEYNDIREDWQKFYKKHFNWDVDFNQVIIPAMPTDDKWRLIFIAKGMMLNLAFDKCKKIFKSWRYHDDLDNKVPTNVRTASNHYAVWVRDEVEPDAEFLGKSTRQADSDMKIGITLLERIIFELKYFDETGNHLDIKGLTFCSGSRDSDGLVPLADWCGGKFKVDWYYLGYSYSDYGIRSAVAL